MNPLLDSDFLIQLNNYRNKIIYARIISLSQSEYPIEQLEGVVTAGSISIDGQSAVRRTCSLTLSARNLNINNVYWGISTKIKIEIGLQNNIIGYEKYGNIIWFPQGIFILTDFKTSQTLNNYTINLTGKDKMCLLNGDVSGNIPAPTIFDSYTDSTGQRHVISSKDTDGYNSFKDEEAIWRIAEGFSKTYGDSYNYIRSGQKIISLQYKPIDLKIDKDKIEGTIQFGTNEEVLNLKNILSDSPNSKGYYDVNIDERYIYGFIVKNCAIGDIFSWEIEQKIPISIIIQELLHQYGQEKYSNIIIRNIEQYALEMLDNNTNSSLFLLNDGTQYVGAVTKQNLINNYRLYPSKNTKELESLKVDEDTGEFLDVIFENGIGEDGYSLIDVDTDSTLAENTTKLTTVIKKGDSSKIYTMRPIAQDEAIGYGMTLLVYPDELKANPGDSITSILDKIVNMLGNYEYFYNLDGQFIFQMKPTYLHTIWNGTIYLDKENYVTPAELIDSIAYIFDDATLTTQYQNSPNINNIKNDFIIWGERKQKEQTIKFHGRYAIENPPVEYTDFNGYTWTAKKITSSTTDKNINGTTRKYALPNEDVDWRELISIMADDWYQHHMEDDYEIILRQNNCWPSLDIDLFPKGRTGYEQFYLDLSSTGGLWTSLYDANYIKYKYIKQHDDLLKLVKKNNVYDESSIYYYLFAAYESELCQKAKYGTIDKKTEITILSCKISYKDQKYIFEITLKEDTNKNNLNEELVELSQYIINKKWNILDFDNKKYQVICEIKPSIQTDKIITKNDSFILQLLDKVEIKDENQSTTNSTTTEDPIELQNNISKLYADLTLYNNRKQYFDATSPYQYWNKNVIENPELLIFWFDFFKADEMGIGKFATSVIGDRPKTINDTSIKTIIYRDTPDVIYCSWDEYQFYKENMVLKDGYPYIIIDENGEGYLAETIDTLFSYYSLLQKAEKENSKNDKNLYLNKIKDFGYSTENDLKEFLNNFSSSLKQEIFIRSVRGKTVHGQAEDMLFQYSHYNDTININTIPIYYLQPNTAISIKDELSNIIGCYIMNKINISLAYNGTMQIAAIKSPDRIY